LSFNIQVDMQQPKISIMICKSYIYMCINFFIHFDKCFKYVVQQRDHLIHLVIFSFDLLLEKIFNLEVIPKVRIYIY
jgi:hypothetical protein